MRLRTLAPALMVFAVLGACGDDGPGQDAAETTTSDITGTTVEGTEPADGTDPVVAGVDFGMLDLPPGEAYEDYALIEDDTGSLEVEVPVEWSDVDTAPSGTDQWPYLLAAAEYDGFFSGWDSPGVFVVNQLVAGSDQEELDAQDERVDLTGRCQAMESFDYDDGSYSGLAELWTGCGPEQATAELVISTFVEDEHLLAMVQLLTDADIAAATRIIETFSFTGE